VVVSESPGGAIASPTALALVTTSFPQGIEAIAPDAAKTGGDFKAVIRKGQGEHVPHPDVCFGAARRGNGSQTR